MKKIFTDSFKVQAVEKALNRGQGITLKDIVVLLGIGRSTLDRLFVEVCEIPVKIEYFPTQSKQGEYRWNSKIIMDNFWA